MQCGCVQSTSAFTKTLPAVTQQATRTAQKNGFKNMFEHETDVRRITFGEFDLGAASKILKEARREAKAARERFWEYDDLIKKAESTVLYGCDADEFVQS